MQKKKEPGAPSAPVSICADLIGVRLEVNEEEEEARGAASSAWGLSSGCTWCELDRA